MSFFLENTKKCLARGFTAVEMLVYIGIFGVIILAVTTFEKDIFFYNNITQANLNTQMEGRRVVKTMVAELRESSPSSLGGYPISQAGTSSITFFSNIDNDNVKEQIRYYLRDEDLYKGVIKPTGNPLTYNAATETVTTVITHIKNSSSTPLFLYYDTNYAGTSTPSLPIPVNIPSVRLIKIDVIIDRNPDRSPTPLTVTSQVTVRNLKDNL